MSIRRAAIGDLGGVIEYMEAYHKSSNINDIPFDKQSAFKVVEYYILGKDTCPLISIEDDEINGVLFGSLEPFFFNKKRNYATDLFFFSTGSGVNLWREFKKWAFGVGAERIIMGVSSGDARAGQLLEALGMESTGGMYVLRR